MKLEFSQQILEKRSNFMKIHPEGTGCSVQTDRQPDMTK